MTGAVRKALDCLTPVSRPYRYRTAGIAYQFFYKELRVWLGYGSLVLLNFTEIGLLVATYYFLGTMIPRGGEYLYGADYFSFVVIGIAFQHFVYEIFFATDQNTRREQTWGTVEEVLASPIRPWAYALGNYTCYHAYSWFYAIVTLALGRLVLGSSLILTPQAIGSAVVMVMLLVTAHLGLGLAAMGLIMVTKAANPAATLFDWAGRLFSGVFFPVAALPPYLRVVSAALPLTHALDALRLVLLAGRTLADSDVRVLAVRLIGFSVVLIPAGLMILNWGYRRARQAGTLGQY